MLRGLKCRCCGCAVLLCAAADISIQVKDKSERSGPLFPVSRDLNLGPSNEKGPREGPLIRKVFSKSPYLFRLFLLDALRGLIFLVSPVPLFFLT